MDEPTPHQPNTPRVWIAKAVAWAKANPVIAAMIGGVLIGLALPVLLRLF